MPQATFMDVNFSFNYLSLFDLEVEGLKVNIKLTFSACQKKLKNKNLDDDFLTEITCIVNC